MKHCLLSVFIYAAFVAFVRASEETGIISTDGGVGILPQGDAQTITTTTTTTTTTGSTDNTAPEADGKPAAGASNVLSIDSGLVSTDAAATTTTTGAADTTASTGAADTTTTTGAADTTTSSTNTSTQDQGTSTNTDPATTTDSTTPATTTDSTTPATTADSSAATTEVDYLAGISDIPERLLAALKFEKAQRFEYVTKMRNECSSAYTTFQSAQQKYTTSQTVEDKILYLTAMQSANQSCRLARQSVRSTIRRIDFLTGTDQFRTNKFEEQRTATKKAREASKKKMLEAVNARAAAANAKKNAGLALFVKSGKEDAPLTNNQVLVALFKQFLAMRPELVSIDEELVKLLNDIKKALIQRAATPVPAKNK